MMQEYFKRFIFSNDESLYVESSNGDVLDLHKIGHLVEGHIEVRGRYIEVDSQSYTYVSALVAKYFPMEALVLN